MWKTPVIFVACIVCLAIIGCGRGTPKESKKWNTEQPTTRCKRVQNYINDYRTIIAHKNDQSRFKKEITALMEKHKVFMEEIGPGTVAARLYPAQQALLAGDEGAFNAAYSKLLEWCKEE